MSESVMNVKLIYLLFDSVNMHRWNDHLCPTDLTELDKQSHKAMIAWYIAKMEEYGGRKIRWKLLIRNCLFSFIQRSVLTDLKPQVFHRIVLEKKKEVNDFVLTEFDRTIPDCDPGFRSDFIEYLHSDKDAVEDAIIRAAHYLATKWEFDLIYESNRSMYGIEDTRNEIEHQIEQHLDLAAVRMLKTDNAFRDFINLVGQLRFQQRWVRTPRIPKTTVLGHSLIVADSMFLHDLDCDVDERQIYNDFYTGLFHDIPEVLTKDVISPIKENVSGLAVLLEDYENDAVTTTIMPLLKEEWADEFSYMALHPFSDMDDPVFGKRNGTDLKACDLLGAFIEANVSQRYGVSSSTLRKGEADLRAKLSVRGKGIDADKIVADFDAMNI